jgi:RNA polymerase sigma-70 factor (ECF subfamily)
VNEAWREHRSYLVAMASRMLRGRADAADVVQEAFVRLSRVDVDEVDELRGWLMVVVRHLCLDLMGSAHSRRDSVPGWLADGSTPLLGRQPTDPADQVTLDDEVQLALALVLDRLTPAERTAFVLHDVFGFPFDAVGDLVGRTPAGCRQLASRARASIRTGARPGRSAIEVTQQRILAERFIAACAGGDIGELMVVLDPDVVGVATLEGHGPFVRLEGREAVARRIFQLFGPGTDRMLVPVPVEGTPGVVALEHGRVIAVFRLDERAGTIHHLEGFVRRPPASRRT